jgi:hypothetical protein
MKTARLQQSKRALRQKLANASIAEKLRMLDALRQRALDIRRGSKSDSTIDAETAAGTAKRLIKKNSELLKRLS